VSPLPIAGTVGGRLATLAVVAAALVAILLDTSAAAIVLVVASLTAAGSVLAIAIWHRLRRAEGSSSVGDGGRESAVLSRLLPVTRAASPYSSLSTYLEHRHASHVVLTFEQIEALLGFSLPATASTEREWWTSPTGGTDGHTDGWTVAGRTATPNLFARNVAFNRSP
jgi:hypothetical protein